MRDPRDIKVKICGITSVYDARLVCSFPINAIGLNFVKRSKRKIGIKTAKEIMDKIPPFIEPVLIFEDEKVSEVMYLTSTLAITTIQLHGVETVSYCHDLKRFNKYMKIIKSFPTKEASISQINAYNKVCDGFLLDSYDRKGRLGGSGRPSDWHVASEIVSKAKVPIILAGGISPDNVSIAIKRVQPFGIDVNSGVESRLGKKDKSMMEKLFQEIHS